MKEDNLGGRLMAKPAARCWAFDGEGESALVPFDAAADADAYVARQNRHQGRGRWVRIDDPSRIPDRPDGTPAVLPQACRISLAGFHSIDCAQALEVAGALAHAAAGRRVIAGQVIATPVEGDVDLEIENSDGSIREWRFARRDARLLAARIAGLAIVCLPLANGES